MKDAARGMARMRVEVTDTCERMIAALAKAGIYGSTRSEVAHSILWRGLSEVVHSGMLNGPASLYARARSRRGRRGK